MENYWEPAGPWGGRGRVWAVGFGEVPAPRCPGFGVVSAPAEPGLAARRPLGELCSRGVCERRADNSDPGGLCPAGPCPAVLDLHFPVKPSPLVTAPELPRELAVPWRCPVAATWLPERLRGHREISSEG